MSTDDIAIKLENIQEVIGRIIDNLGSNNQEAITLFGELEMEFESLQEAFDDLEMEMG